MNRGKLLLAGALAGVVNGFFGGAGGVVLVVLLGWWSGLEQKQIFATTVGVMLVLSIISVLVYHGRAELTWQQLWPYLLGGAAGGIAGGLWLKKLRAPWLQKAFALLVLLAGLKGVLGL